MKLSFSPYTLELRHTFTVAAGSRVTTPVVFTQIEHDGVIGYGEASMPPYLGESQESVLNFLAKVNLSRFSDPLDIDGILSFIDHLAPGNNAAKASLDIALHDLASKMAGMPLYRFLGIGIQAVPDTSYTIGIDTPERVKEKVKEASEFNLLKIKLGSANDKEIVEAIRSMTNKPLCADINQGWQDKAFALDMIHWLKELGFKFIEQPLPKELTDDIAWLTSQSPLPIIADEGIKRFDDLVKFLGAYSGVNVKLMKSTGIYEAKRMLDYANKAGAKTMIGCMTESSCAVSAAAHLSSLTQYADLDGPFLIKNNPFEDIRLENGKIIISDTPGIGVNPRK